MLIAPAPQLLYLSDKPSYFDRILPLWRCLSIPNDPVSGGSSEVDYR